MLQLCTSLQQIHSHENFSKWCRNSGVARTWWSKRSPRLFHSFLHYATFVSWSLLLAECSSKCHARYATANALFKTLSTSGYRDSVRFGYPPLLPVLLWSMPLWILYCAHVCCTPSIAQGFIMRQTMSLRFVFPVGDFAAKHRTWMPSSHRKTLEFGTCVAGRSYRFASVHAPASKLTGSRRFLLDQSIACASGDITRCTLVTARQVLAITERPEEHRIVFFNFVAQPLRVALATFGTVNCNDILNSMCVFTWNA